MWHGNRLTHDNPWLLFLLLIVREGQRLLIQLFHINLAIIITYISHKGKTFSASSNFSSTKNRVCQNWLLEKNYIAVPR